MKEEKITITNAQELRQEKCNVPTLRFSNKTIWEKKRIKDFCEVNPKTEELEDEFIYIDLESVSKGCLLSKNIISKTNAPSRAQRVLKNNDILFQCVRPYQMNNLLFNAENADFQYVASTGYAQIRTQENSSFVYQLLHSSKFNKEVMLRCTGSSYPAISSSDLEDIEVYICGVEEQQKIGYFLDLIDRRIAVQNKIISKYETLIKGLTDCLLNKKEDNYYTFKDLYLKAGEGGTPTTDNNSYYENGTIPFIKIDDLSQKYIKRNSDYITHLGLEKSAAWLIPTNSVIFSNGATIGRISINTYPIATKQGVLGIVPSSIVMAEYLYYYMKTTYFRRQVRRITVKGTMDCAYLKDLNSIICHIPDINHQEKRIALLTVLDEKIACERMILQKLKEQKKYLLSKMFI